MTGTPRVPLSSTARRSRSSSCADSLRLPPSESAAATASSAATRHSLHGPPRLAASSTSDGITLGCDATAAALAPAPSPPLDAIGGGAATHGAHILALFTASSPPRSPPKPPNPPIRVAAFTFDARAHTARDVHESSLHPLNPSIVPVAAKQRRPAAAHLRSASAAADSLWSSARRRQRQLRRPRKPWGLQGPSAASARRWVGRNRHGAFRGASSSSHARFTSTSAASRPAARGSFPESIRPTPRRTRR